MKALTVYQPWASLISIGAKRYETRNWATNYRGPIAIHAGLKKYSDYGILGGLTLGAMENALTVGGISWYFLDLPFGAVVATAELAGCWEIDFPTPAEIEWHGYCAGQRRLRGKNAPADFIKDDELLFGDWTPGRFAWKLANVKLLPKPVPAKGKQGLWEWLA